MPSRSAERNWIVTGSLVILAAVALALVLQYTKVILVPFVLSLFVVSLVSPMSDYMVLRLRFPRWLSVAVAMLVVLVFIAVFVLISIGIIQTVVGTANDYADNVATVTRDTLARIKDYGVEVNEDKLAQDLRNMIPRIVSGSVGTVFGFLTTILFVLIFVIFLLAGRDPRTIRTGVLAQIDTKIRRYLAIKFALSALTGLLVYLILSFVGLELAAMFGMLTFILNFIPSVGSVIAVCLPIPIALAQFDTALPIVAAIALPGAVQLVIGNIIDPKLSGDGLELHPVAVLMALAFWGLLWGPVGMILAVPMTAILRLVLIQFETLRPMGDLLAGKLPGFMSDDVNGDNYVEDTQRTADGGEGALPE